MMLPFAFVLLAYLRSYYFLCVAKTGSVVDSATYDLAADDLAADEGVDDVTRC
jgi:hypothetical protein